MAWFRLVYFIDQRHFFQKVTYGAVDLNPQQDVCSLAQSRNGFAPLGLISLGCVRHGRRKGTQQKRRHLGTPLSEGSLCSRWFSVPLLGEESKKWRGVDVNPPFWDVSSIAFRERQAIFVLVRNVGIEIELRASKRVGDCLTHTPFGDVFNSQAT